MKIPTQIERRIQELLKEAGVGPDENVILNHMHMSNAPSDLFLTEAALRRAAHEAKDIEADYYCYMCGEHHDTPESFMECMQDHIINFYAGVPSEMTADHVEKIVDTTPGHMKDHVRGILSKNIKERKNGVTPEKEKE